MGVMSFKELTEIQLHSVFIYPISYTTKR